ncbi:MAG: sigma70-ECF: polymerase sigma factor, sigma-70 family [Firmicutes bacterium]|nr:sigma70-ECF: polymerase sigma factor, sigma-70 family [Bacillota bacterium]
MKIKYEFLTGETVEIEAPDSVVEVSIEIDRAIYKNDRREKRRHNSIEALAEHGIQIADCSNEIAATVEAKETHEVLHKALDILIPKQRELIRKVFFEGRSISEVARAEGIDESSVRERLSRIYKKLKNILK